MRYDLAIGVFVLLSVNGFLRPWLKIQDSVLMQAVSALS